jgi:xanthine/CO dehydrogenase XdhC/CoxF family maturation factor
MKELAQILDTLIRHGGAGAALATLVSVEGSSYRRAGARLLLRPDGTRLGSISGGCLEEDVLARAQRVAANGKAEVVVYDTTAENDLVWGVGLGCHGVVKVLIEPLSAKVEWAAALAERWRRRECGTVTVRYESDRHEALGTFHHDAAAQPQAGCFVQRIAPPTKLAIFGAGNDAQPLARMASGLGWVVTVCDPRPAMAEANRFPEASAVITGAPETLVPRAKLDAESVAVVMTHHYVHDVPLLRALMPTPVRYIGLLGPRKRAEKILRDLQADGVELSDGQRSRLHAPVGLDIGAEGPDQVALSIVAEIQAELSGRDGRPLRHRERPIHR